MHRAHGCGKLLGRTFIMFFSDLHMVVSLFWPYSFNCPSMDIYTKHGTKPRNSKTLHTHNRGGRAGQADGPSFRLTRRNSAPLQPV